MFKKLIRYVALILLTTSNCVALQRSQALALTATATITSGIYYYGHKTDEKNFDIKIRRALWGATIVGGVVGWLAFRNTPAGLLRRAKANFPHDHNVAALLQSKQSKGSIMPAVEMYYIKHSTPLISAFNAFSAEHTGNKRANRLLDRFDELAAAMPAGDRKVTLSHAASEHRTLVTSSLPLIEAALLEIKQQPNFLKEQKADAAQQTADATRRNAEANAINAAVNATRPWPR